MRASEAPFQPPPRRVKTPFRARKHAQKRHPHTMFGTQNHRLAPVKTRRNTFPHPRPALPDTLPRYFRHFHPIPDAKQHPCPIQPAPKPIMDPSQPHHSPIKNPSPATIPPRIRSAKTVTNPRSRRSPKPHFAIRRNDKFTTSPTGIIPHSEPARPTEPSKKQPGHASARPGTCLQALRQTIKQPR